MVLNAPKTKNQDTHDTPPQNQRRLSLLGTYEYFAPEIDVALIVGLLGVRRPEILWM
jgi:hypothetical protein